MKCPAITSWNNISTLTSKAAGIEDDRKGPLFRAAIGKTKKLGQGAISRTDVWYMVRRRASDAGIETAIGCHTFRATGITDYLTNGGRIEVAQRMAGHSNAKTTGLYDRRNDDISRRGNREDRDLIMRRRLALSLSFFGLFVLFALR
jgi:integrase